jgi:hypothetical protein
MTDVQYLTYHAKKILEELMVKIQPIDRSLVLRQGVERYLLTTLVSFALSVITIRLFLDLTGYPQLGNANLHIAHVLWGGLLLFIGGLLPLVLANAWAYSASAVLNGVGMGLFIDEVGKFITQTYDYFYPPAAPIIYAFFLLMVLLYLYVRRPAPLSARRRMYQALHNLGEVLDHDLQPEEKFDLSADLQQVMLEEPDGNLGRLAEALIQFLNDETLYISMRSHSFTEQILHSWLKLRQKAQQSWLPERRFRILLVITLTGSALWVLLGMALFVTFLFTQGNLMVYLIRLMSLGDFASLNALRFSFIRVVLEGSFGLLQLYAALLILRGRQVLGVRLAILSLVMMLTTVDLLVFYLDQFSATLAVLAQFSLLLLLLFYRDLYLKRQAPK